MERSSSRPSWRIARQLPPGLLVHSELSQQRRETWSPCAARAFAVGEDSGDGGELGEAALLATDPEHLDAVDPRGSAAREQTAPLVRALGGSLGLGQPSGAQGQRRGVVLGDVQRERLAQADGHRVDLGELALGRLQIAQSDQAGHAPLHRLGLKIARAEALRQVASLGQHLERMLETALAARPVRAHQHRREAEPIVEPPSHRDRALAHDPARRVVTDEGVRATQPGEQHHAKLGIIRPRARATPLRAARRRPRR